MHSFFAIAQKLQLCMTFFCLCVSLYCVSTMQQYVIARDRQVINSTCCTRLGFMLSICKLNDIALVLLSVSAQVPGVSPQPSRMLVACAALPSSSLRQHSCTQYLPKPLHTWGRLHVDAQAPAQLLPKCRMLGHVRDDCHALLWAGVLVAKVLHHLHTADACCLHL